MEQTTQATVNPFAIFAVAAAKAALAVQEINVARAAAGKAAIVASTADQTFTEATVEKVEQALAVTKITAARIYARAKQSYAEFSITELCASVKLAANNSYNRVAARWNLWFCKQSQTEDVAVHADATSVSAEVQPTQIASVESTLVVHEAPVAQASASKNVYEKFTEFYNRMNASADHQIPFNPDWTNGNGGFAGAVPIDSVNTAGRENVTFFTSVTPKGRRVLLIKTPVGYLVVYDRHNDHAKNQVINYNAPTVLASMNGVDDTGEVTPELSEKLFSLMDNV